MSVTAPRQTRRTAHQIIGAGGDPAPTAVTSNLWVSRPEAFSRPSFGNKIQSFVAGKDYFANLIAALDQANKEVYIAGWQINWDAMLARGVRLYDVVYRVAKRGVDFYVMPWDDANPIQTYETQTKTVLESINGRLRSERVSGAGTVTVMSAGTQSDRNSQYFSHHQKQVLVDQAIAYVGGMDIAYGRYDDARFNLYCQAEGRRILNSYNPSLPAMATVSASGGLGPALVDPDLMTGGWDNVDVPFVGTKSNAAIEAEKLKAGGLQMPYEKNGVFNFDNPALEGDTPLLRTLSVNQPREPWEDVHARIEGPAATDLVRNFVQRWNSLTSRAGRLRLPARPPPAAPDRSACIQVLRSAPFALRSAEHGMLSDKRGVAPPTGAEDDIHTAMRQLIQKANRFIYVENQFFVSDFGRIGGPTGALSPAAAFIKNGAGGIKDNKLNLLRRWDSDEGAALDRLPQNGICRALVDRIQRAILDAARPTFHVYITLPVHSEGSLLDAAVAAQVYYTMQTISFGSRSLLNGIKRALKGRALRDAKDARWQRVFEDNNTEYTSISTDACFEYVTLLNLRNWDDFGRVKGSIVVTEQVYVHSKLLIVDDLYALFGSANINDRSLLGIRDSELAVLVMDGETRRADVNGTGSNQPVRAFAHELRKSIWKKIFGLTGNVRPATELAQAVEQPGSPSTWKLIQRRAQTNAELYEQAFPWIPRSWVINGQGEKVPASILPTWDTDAQRLRSPLPYEERFWTQKRPSIDTAGLEQVRGFITALPIEWTRGENVRIQFPTSLIVHADPKPRTPGPTREAPTEVAAHAEPAESPRTSAA